MSAKGTELYYRLKSAADDIWDAVESFGNTGRDDPAEAELRKIQDANDDLTALLREIRGEEMGPRVVAVLPAGTEAKGGSETTCA